MNEIAARLRRLPADTLACLAFFSRLPTARGDAADLRLGAGAWPLAGLVLAVVPAAILLALRAAEVPALVAAAMALAAAAALSGGLHEDGLSDAADGLGGGRTREEKLALMRDSRLGTYGGLALVFTVLLRVAALAALAWDAAAAALALLLVGLVSRSMALWHWNALLPARSDGLAVAAGRPDWAALATGLVLGGLAALVLLVAFGGGGALALILAGLGAALFTGLCRRQIGGHTGDTIGAAQQIAETLLLVGLSAGAPQFLVAS